MKKQATRIVFVVHAHDLQRAYNSSMSEAAFALGTVAQSAPCALDPFPLTGLHLQLFASNWAKAIAGDEVMAQVSLHVVAATRVRAQSAKWTLPARIEQGVAARADKLTYKRSVAYDGLPLVVTHCGLVWDGEQLRPDENAAEAFASVIRQEGGNLAAGDHLVVVTGPIDAAPISLTGLAAGLNVHHVRCDADRQVGHAVMIPSGVTVLVNRFTGPRSVALHKAALPLGAGPALVPDLAPFAAGNAPALIWEMPEQCPYAGA